jgi:DNA invertase Pin-like site-specific DNA recombinase
VTKAYSYLRYSSPSQADGDSIRRQTALTEAWCERNGVTLDKRLKLRDEGVSAFRGGHRENPDKHALASFLALVRAGRITPGSILIVENLDRLSREEIVSAVRLFLDLLDAGVVLVQLAPECRFDRADLDPMKLMMAVMELSRGHGESAVKSARIGAAWSSKREKIAGTKMTAKAPGWVKLSADRKTFTVIPKVVAVVKRIFAMAVAGHGCRVIAQKLNDEGIPSPGYSGEWSTESVRHTLRNRSVLGEFTPHVGRRATRNRKPAGPPIPDYYPAVIDPATFHAAQKALAGRRNQRGPQGKGVANLFTSLIVSGDDGHPMHINVKPPRGRRLVSAGAMRGAAGSKYLAFPLWAFERAFLALVRKVDPRDLAPQAECDGAAQVAELTGRVGELDYRIGELTRRLDAEFSPLLLDKLTQYERERASAAADLERVKAEQDIGDPVSELRDVMLNLDEAGRLRAKSLVRQLVSRITLWVRPAGGRHTHRAVAQIDFRDGGQCFLKVTAGPRGRLFAVAETADGAEVFAEGYGGTDGKPYEFSPVDPDGYDASIP